jgi:sodium-dependent dicarboxylate transporter 2/3/5
MTWQEFSAGAPWGICVVLAGAVSLANALTRTGAAGWLAGGLFGWIALPGGAGPMAVAVFVVTALITLAIPNRAAAITLGVPLATAYAASGALSHAAAGLIVMIAVDAETIYPAQTAANLLAYERGYFSAGRLARFNLITLGAALLVVVFVALPWWSLIGLPR